MAPEDPTLLDALSEAVESGAGLPAVARAAARLLDASVAMIDRSSAVLAVAGASPAQERRLIDGGEGVTTVELRVADAAVGQLRYRARATPDPTIARMVTTLLALELERSRSPEWESEEMANGFVVFVNGPLPGERERPCGSLEPIRQVDMLSFLHISLHNRQRDVISQQKRISSLQLPLL